MRPNRNVEIHECYFEYTATRVKKAMQLITAKDRLDDDDIQTVRILTDVYQSLTNIRQESNRLRSATDNNVCHEEAQ